MGSHYPPLSGTINADNDLGMSAALVPSGTAEASGGSALSASRAGFLVLFTTPLPQLSMPT